MTDLTVGDLTDPERTNSANFRTEIHDQGVDSYEVLDGSQVALTNGDPSGSSHFETSASSSGSYAIDDSFTQTVAGIADPTKDTVTIGFNSLLSGSGSADSHLAIDGTLTTDPSDGSQTLATTTAYSNSASGSEAYSSTATEDAYIEELVDNDPDDDSLTTTTIDNDYASDSTLDWSSSGSGSSTFTITTYDFDVDEDGTIEEGEQKADVTLVSTDTSAYEETGASHDVSTRHVELRREELSTDPNLTHFSQTIADDQQDIAGDWTWVLHSEADLDITDSLTTTENWAEEDPAASQDSDTADVTFTSTVTDEYDATTSGTFGSSSSFQYQDHDVSDPSLEIFTSIVNNHEEAGTIDSTVRDHQSTTVNADGSVVVGVDYESDLLTGTTFSSSNSVTFQGLEETGDGGGGSGSVAEAYGIMVHEATGAASGGSSGSGPIEHVTFAYSGGSTDARDGHTYYSDHQVVNLTTTATPKASGSGSGGGSGSASGEMSGSAADNYDYLTVGNVSSDTTSMMWLTNLVQSNVFAGESVGSDHKPFRREQSTGGIRLSPFPTPAPASALCAPADIAVAPRDRAASQRPG